ncbi:MAG: guanitoxin biosynthesis L-arginine gamma (S) hydroxylase [Niallia nealsonii]|nr:guanitoxin biosynthesis L-arginine gamma (S) hydroxylase [Niallia nealsonii]
MLNYQFSKEIKKELRALIGSNNYRGIIGIVYDFVMISVSIILTNFSWWFYPLALLIIGSRQRALATILHDAAHNCLAKNKKLNYILGTFFSGYLIGQEFKNYKLSHVKGHHAHLGDKEKDPDYKYHLQVGLYDIGDKRQFLVKYLIKPIFLLNIVSYLSYVFKNRMLQYKIAPREYLIMFLYWILILLTLFYFSALHFFLLFWIVPYITTFSILGWFIEMAEHYPLVHENNESLYMTRNRFSNWLESFFLSGHSENFHLTHHLMPSIPYWNISKAHKIMMKDKLYRDFNEQMGGVFFSSNKNKPIMFDLIVNRKFPILNKFQQVK